MDLSDFSLVLRMLSYVLRMCGMLRYKGIDMGYSLETNKEDSFFNIAKTDKTRVESKELKYLMKAGCGVHFFVCLIAEVKSIFISPHAISLTINSVLLRKLFDFCHAQKREIRNCVANKSLAAIINERIMKMKHYARQTVKKIFTQVYFLISDGALLEILLTKVFNCNYANNSKRILLNGDNYCGDILLIFYFVLIFSFYMCHLSG